MRVLRNLSDIDKHRIIVPTLVLPKEVNLKFDFDGARFLRVQYYMRPGQEMKTGTELAAVYLAGGVPGQRKVAVEIEIVSQPFIPVTLARPWPGIAAVTVGWVWEQASKWCAEVIRELEECS